MDLCIIPMDADVEDYTRTLKGIIELINNQQTIIKDMS